MVPAPRLQPLFTILLLGLLFTAPGVTAEETDLFAGFELRGIGPAHGEGAPLLETKQGRALLVGARRGGDLQRCHPKGNGNPLDGRTQRTMRQFP